MADSTEGRPGTDDAEYAERLVRLQTRSWKTKLDVQRVYRWNIARMQLGRTVEVGCGIGRMLKGLPEGSVGVDHNPHSIKVAREFGYTAYTVEEWDASDLAASAAFDGMLLAHVVEHMTEDDITAVVEHYLPAMKPGGKVAFVVPQEVGYRSDETHVRFIDVPELTALCTRLGLAPEKSWSYPFPRPVGKAFIYNETCMVARVPG